MEAQLTTLGEILSGHSRDLNAFLYLPFDERWKLSTRAAILTQSETDGIPTFASENGLNCTLQMGTVDEIASNAHAQLQGNVSTERLLEAFLFYYDRDAFIEFAD